MTRNPKISRPFKVTINGATKTYREWGLACGVSCDLIRKRYTRGVRGSDLLVVSANALLLIEIDGRKKTYAAWSELAGVCEPTIRHRYGKGVRGQELLIKPNQKRNKSATGGAGLPLWERVSRSVLKECQWLSYEDANAYECTK